MPQIPTCYLPSPAPEDASGSLDCPDQQVAVRRWDQNERSPGRRPGMSTRHERTVQFIVNDHLRHQDATEKKTVDHFPDLLATSANIVLKDVTWSEVAVAIKIEVRFVGVTR